MDYQNGKIYTIRSHYTNKFYIGSTCSTLIKRLSQHTRKANATSAREILRHEDYYIELLELYPCNSKMELNKREGELIRMNKDICVNIQMRELPLTEEEKKERANEYRKINKEQTKEREKEKNKINLFYAYYYTNKREEYRAKLKEPEKMPL